MDCCLICKLEAALQENPDVVAVERLEPMELGIETVDGRRFFVTVESID